MSGLRGPNRGGPARRAAPGDAAAHPRVELGETLHAFAAEDGWYVVAGDGVRAIAPDREALLAWCLEHVRGHCDDTIIILHDAPCEDAAEEEDGW